jgi:hypothetical protein
MLGVVGVCASMETDTMRTANQRVERTGGSRLAQLQFERQRRLPPVAHAFRWTLNRRS